MVVNGLITKLKTLSPTLYIETSGYFNSVMISTLISLLSVRLSNVCTDLSEKLRNWLLVVPWRAIISCLASKVNLFSYKSQVNLYQILLKIFFSQLLSSASQMRIIILDLPFQFHNPYKPPWLHTFFFPHVL